MKAFSRDAPRRRQGDSFQSGLSDSADFPFFQHRGMGRGGLVNRRGPCCSHHLICQRFLAFRGASTGRLREKVNPAQEVAVDVKRLPAAGLTFMVLPGIWKA